ncbi:MAG: phage GP46 family protein [Pseudomonadota bacterium]
MVQLIIRQDEACAPVVSASWDTVWVVPTDRGETTVGGFGDWILATPQTDRDNAGGLRARAALHTATVLQLFTDARAPDDLELLDGQRADRRGWWGDTYKLSNEPADFVMGSLLWTVTERGILTDDTARRVEEYAADALETLQRQGAVSATSVSSERITTVPGALGLQVTHFDATGAEIYAERFGFLWEQASSPVPMRHALTGGEPAPTVPARVPVELGRKPREKAPL